MEVQQDPNSSDSCDECGKIIWMQEDYGYAEDAALLCLSCLDKETIDKELKEE
jgi:hypothetical protein